MKNVCIGTFLKQILTETEVKNHGLWKLGKTRVLITLLGYFVIIYISRQYENNSSIHCCLMIYVHINIHFLFFSTLANYINYGWVPLLSTSDTTGLYSVCICIFIIVHNRSQMIQIDLCKGIWINRNFMSFLLDIILYV